MAPMTVTLIVTRCLIPTLATAQCGGAGAQAKELLKEQDEDFAKKVGGGRGGA